MAQIHAAGQTGGRSPGLEAAIAAYLAANPAGTSTLAQVDEFELPASPAIGETITVLASQSTILPATVTWDSGGEPTVEARLLISCVWSGTDWVCTYGMPIPSATTTTTTTAATTTTTTTAATTTTTTTAATTTTTTTAATTTTTTTSGSTGELFTDFSTYTTGAAPSDWTSRWVSGATLTVQADGAATGGKVLRLVQSTQQRSFFSWDAMSSFDGTQEYVAKYRAVGAWTPASGRVIPGMLYASGAAAAENGYYVYRTPSVTQSSKYVTGTSTALGGLLSSANSLADTWYWSRFRVEDGELMYKRWTDGDSEPAAWDVTDLDSSLTGGLVGVFAFTALTVEWDIFGVAWGGGTAPKVAP